MSDFPGWTPGFHAALEQLAIAARLPARAAHPGAVGSRQRGRSLEFADYRAYAPGDDPRLVDWRAYSRLDRLYLKQFDEERARTVTLLLDVSASLDWGEGDAHKGRYARRLAAALAWIALCRHESVRVALLRDGSAIQPPRASTRAAAFELFVRLDAARDEGRTGLAAACRHALGGWTTGTAILLTDLLDPTWPDAIDALAAPREGVLIQVLAPDECDPPPGEEVELEDAETGERRPTRLGPLELAAYHARLDELREAARQTCARHGLPFVSVNTSNPLTAVVLHQLAATGILRTR